MKVILYILGLVVFLTPPVFAGELEETCKKLSAESEHQYEAVYGKVMSVNPYPAHPCYSHNKDCSQAEVILVVQLVPVPPFGEVNEETIFLYTTAELQEEFYNKPRYMKREESYKLCARKIEKMESIPVQLQYLFKEEEKTKSDIQKYHIDHLETIQPHKPAHDEIPPPVFAGELEETCKKLSTESEYEYEAVYGYFTMDYSQGWTKHACPSTQNCVPENRNMLFEMLALPPLSASKKEYILVFTKPIPKDEFDTNFMSYFDAAGSKKQFCARRIDENGNPVHDHSQHFNYIVDDYRTFQPYSYSHDEITPPAFAGELEGTCKKLSAESEYEYLAVYAKVIGFSNHCPKSMKCSEERKTALTIMQALPPFSDKRHGAVATYTRPMLVEEYFDKGPFFKGDNSYKFCARNIRETDLNDKPITYFIVDHLETIQSYDPKDEGVTLTIPEHRQSIP